MSDQGSALVVHFVGGDAVAPQLAGRSAPLTGVSSIDTAPGEMTVSLLPGAHMTPLSLPGRLVIDVRPPATGDEGAKPPASAPANAPGNVPGKSPAKSPAKSP